MESSYLKLSTTMIITLMALAIAQTSLALPDYRIKCTIVRNLNGPGKPAVQSPVPSADVPADSVNDFLHGHNTARAAVGVPPVTWNATVAAFAEAYAARRSVDCQMEHSYGPYGENIAEGGQLSATDAVTMWVGERPNYDHPSNSCVGGECLHYTQVVWRDTSSIGCARAKCRNGWTFVTCNYYPPGNYEGQSPY